MLPSLVNIILRNENIRAFLTIFISLVMMLLNLPHNILSQSSTSLVPGKADNATYDYYNKYYNNTLLKPSLNKTLASANLSEWKIDLSNNGWTFAQSWKEVIGNTSNIMVE